MPRQSSEVRIAESDFYYSQFSLNWDAMSNVRMYLFLFLLAFAVGDFSAAQEKSKLRILYVGANSLPESRPNLRPTQSLPKHHERRKRMALARPKAFEKFLSKHFESVTVTMPGEYKPADSASYDVTIFDEIPGFIGGQAKHPILDAKFSNAAITIGEVATRIVRNSKLDYL